MSSSSGGYFHQSCHVKKAYVSLNWYQRWQTCWVLRRGCWRSACCRRHPRICSILWCISATSAKFPLRKCDKWWLVRLSKVPFFSTETVKDISWRLETLELHTPFEKFLYTPLVVSEILAARLKLATTIQLRYTSATLLILLNFSFHFRKTIKSSKRIARFFAIVSYWYARWRYCIYHNAAVFRIVVEKIIVFMYRQLCYFSLNLHCYF